MPIETPKIKKEQKQTWTNYLLGISEKHQHKENQTKSSGFYLVSWTLALPVTCEISASFQTWESTPESMARD